MSRYLLDTHACVYALVAPGKLGRRARRAMTAVEAGDPFDRLIVAAARALDAKLVTRDRPIDDLGLVQTIWA